MKTCSLGGYMLVKAIRQQSRNRRMTDAVKRIPPRCVRCSIHRSCNAGSKMSCAMRRGRKRINTFDGGSGIRPPLPADSQHDVVVKPTRCLPGFRSRSSNPVAAFGDSLIADRNLLIPAFHESIDFQPGHHLIESRRGSSNAIIGKDAPDDTSGTVLLQKDAQNQELQMCDLRYLLTVHNATLYT